MKQTIQKMLAMMLAMLLAISLPAFAEADGGTISGDIIAGIDSGSITVEGETTFFSSTMSDGTVVRFQGTDIAINEDGVMLQPGGRLVSLDSIGKIAAYSVVIKDGDQSPIDDQILNIGYGYTNSPEKLSVQFASDLYADELMGYYVQEWNNCSELSIAEFAPNFVFVASGYENTVEFTLTSLTIQYDPTEKFTDIEVPRSVLPDHFANFEEYFASMEMAHEEYYEEENCEENYYDYADLGEELIEISEADVQVMPENDAIYSDIVAGIDFAGVSTDGDATFFSSTMSDGTVVRFEGYRISISEDGISMEPGATITSLDSVGKIYEYAASVKDKDDPIISRQWLTDCYGYTFSLEKSSVERASDVFTYRIGTMQAPYWDPEMGYTTVACYEPNFVRFEADAGNEVPVTLTSLNIGYNPNDKVTGIVEAVLDAYRYGYYMDGYAYDIDREDMADESQGQYDFYLMLRTETAEETGLETNDNWLMFLPNTFYEVGDLKDADGHVLDKETARVYEGYTLDITIGDYALTLDLPMAELYEGAQTMKDARPYSTMTSTGEQNVLVVPIVWADQTELATDELYVQFRKQIGRLIDEQGNPIGDFSDPDDEDFSLTEYFEIASYGQLDLSSFMTDWYFIDKTFGDDYEYIFPEVEFADEVLEWVKTAYPDTDWSQFDQDGDGCVDAFVLLSVGLTKNEGYMPASFGGAVHSTGNMYGKLGGTQEDPMANSFLTVNCFLMSDGDTNTLIHEFSHNFGLNDYYDTEYSGIDAVGRYDMQSSNVGDWNAYSKLAVGWMQPQVVTGLESGESVEMTIGSSALVGDVIVLPAAGTEYEGPFSEYVMIDLFSDDGVNAYDAAEYALGGVTGVRISHVNAYLRAASESDSVQQGYIETNGNIIGEELQNNSYNADGIYNVEVIQSSGINTFTELDNLISTLSANDFFYAGDTFSAEDYGEFFCQGLMDNGLPLGYTVEILSIDTDADGNPSATIRITAK